MKLMLLGAGLMLLGVCVGLSLATPIDAGAVAKWWDLLTSFGTAGAVIAAVGIALWQNSSTRARNRQEPLLALQAILERVAYVIGEVPTESQFDGQFVEYAFTKHFNTRTLDGARRVLYAYPVERLLDPQAVMAVFEMHDAIETACRLVDTVLPLKGNWQARLMATGPQLRAAQEQAQKSLTLLSVALEGAGISER